MVRGVVGDSLSVYFFLCVSKVFFFFFVFFFPAAHTKDECHASYFLLITSVHLEAFGNWLMLRQKKWNTFPISSLGMTKPLLILARACAAIWSLVEHIKLEKNKTKCDREKKKIIIISSLLPSSDVLTMKCMHETLSPAFPVFICKYRISSFISYIKFPLEYVQSRSFISV